MNYEQIAELLDRYWEGESTLDEERRLRAYFTGNDVDARLLRFRPLFLALKAEAEIAAPGKAKIVRIPMLSASARLFRWAAAASVVGLLAAGGWWFSQQPGTNAATAEQTNPKLYEDTFDDPEQAAAEIKAALALVSSKMKKGKKEAAKGLQKVEVVDKFIIKPKSKTRN